jgi:hypothetical protein
VAQPDGAAGVADGEEKIRTIDPFGAGRAQPNERHAVGRGEPGAAIGGFEGGVALRERETVGGAVTDVAAADGAAVGDDCVPGRREAEG